MSSSKSDIWRQLSDELEEHMFMTTRDVDERDQAWISTDRLNDFWYNKRNGQCRLSKILSSFQDAYRPFFKAGEPGSFLKIVSLLIQLGETNWSVLRQSFGPGKLLDADLPLRLDQLAQVHGFTRRLQKRFLTDQYAFLPVIINAREGEDEDEFENHNNGNFRLPLISEGPKNTSGSYSDVTKVEIAPGHFRDKDKTLRSTSLVVARKRFDIAPNYEHEIYILKSLLSSPLKHDHIMGHLASAKIGKEFNIFFPWAEFNLHELVTDESLKLIPPNNLTPQNLLKGAASLAGALKFLHTQLSTERGSVPCCHMDLKPENILIMKDEVKPCGIWKISDFGIANIVPQSITLMHDIYGQSNPRNTSRPSPELRTRRYTGPFQPPEADPKADNRRANTKNEDELNEDELKGDIWSFGCILIVLLLFSIGGPEYTEALSERRNESDLDEDRGWRKGYFYRKVNGIFGIRSNIQEWIGPLVAKKQGWANVMWNFVMKEMLTAEPSARESAATVEQYLWHSARRAEDINIWNAAPAVPPLSGLSSSSRGALTPISSHISRQRPSTPKRLPSHPARFSRSNMVGSDQDISSPISRHGQSSSPGSASQPVDEGLFPSRPHLYAASPRSSVSHGSASPASPSRLAHFLRGEKRVRIANDGLHIVYWNQDMAIVYAKSHSGKEIFSRNNCQPEPVPTKSMWDQVQIAGSFLALKCRETSFIFSRSVHRGAQLYNWSTQVAMGLVMGFALSPAGTMAFRLRRSVKVYSFIPSVVPILEEDWKENINAMSFDSGGERLIAISDSYWVMWQLSEQSTFLEADRNLHKFRRGEHGNFEPHIVPFANRSSFLLWDRENRDRIRIIEGSRHTPHTVPRNTKAVAVTCDNEYLLVLTRTSSLRQTTHYLMWHQIGRNPAGKLEVQDSHTGQEINTKTRCNSLEMVAFREDGANFALIAFSDGELHLILLIPNT